MFKLFILILEIVFGAIVGSIAGKVMNKNFGFWRNSFLGMAGGVVGNIIGKFIGTGGGFVLSIIGACFLIWIYGEIKKKI